MEFANPWWFLALPVVGGLAFFYFRMEKNRHAPLRLSSLEAFGGHETWRGQLRRVLPVLRILSLILLVFALARPQKALQEEKVKAEGIDILLVMDLSSSMLAKDFRPDRLAVSKKVAADFVEKRRHDRIGLVSFAGEAFTQCPLTTDHRVVQELLAGLAVGRLADGTAIGMGLATAVNRLQDTSGRAKSQVIILLTDGVNNAGYVQPEKAAEIARTLGVKVYCIGVGSMGQALSPVSRTPDGEYIFDLTQVEIDESLMEKMATMTGGQYFRATTEAALEEIYAQIDRLEKTELEVKTILRFKDFFGWFLGFALLFLSLEMGLRWTVFRSIS